MMKIADITFTNNAFILSGDLDFLNVMSLYEKTLPAISTNQSLTFDFSGVKSSDSSGLALIIEWIKLAKKNQQAINFKNLSPDMYAIAKAAGLEPLILSVANTSS